MENEQLITVDELLTRYSHFSMFPGKKLTVRSLFNWRRSKGFPEPHVNRPRLVWKKSDVLKWEKENGYDYL